MDDSSFTNDKYLHSYIWGKGTMGNWRLGNGTFHNVSEETRHFYYLGNGTFYSLGEGTLNSLGNGTFYPLGIGTLILWESGHLSSGNRDMGNGTQPSRLDSLRLC